MEQTKGSKPSVEKYSSRKLFITQLVLGLSTITPIAFKYIGIESEITMMVIGIYVSAGSVYGIANAFDKKWGGQG